MLGKPYYFSTFNSDRFLQWFPERRIGEGLLGCFGLTEKLAGVNSGGVVNTIAEWDDGALDVKVSELRRKGSIPIPRCSGM